MMDYSQWQRYIEAHPAQSLKSAMAVQLAIEKTPLNYQPVDIKSAVPICTHTLQIPKIFSQEDKKIFEQIASTCYGIFEKTIDAYKKDPAVRRLFNFSPALEHLILHDPGYPVRIPICRVDIFYDEKTKSFQFCECNTDGTSAMYENDTMAALLPLNNAYQQLGTDLEYMPLMETFADAFLQTYASFQNAQDKPSIAIVDLVEDAYIPEHEAFARLFTNRGYVCEVVDLRDLDYDGSSLFSTKTGTRFNAIYRRAVTMDLMNHYHDSLPLILAVQDGNAALIGDFQTQIIHSKKINEALLSDQLSQYFTEEERQFLKDHLPYTMDLTSKNKHRVLENKDAWILKPRDGFAAKGVWAGVDVPEKLWKKLVDDFADTPYIAQTYVHHFQTPNIDLINHGSFKDYSNMSGLYLYNGKFAGVYSRLSDQGIISTQYNERMVPTLFEKEEEADSQSAD